RELDVDFVFLAYSDLPQAEVMHRASLVQSCGAAFALLGPKQTQLRSKLPVISVTAVRTGAGKSPLTQWLAQQLIEQGHRPGVIRHPMPYGDLTTQTVERFVTLDDLDQYECTIEEREEYTPYVERGIPVYAGVDYQQILSAAEENDDVILWDGGNNDYSFIHPDLSIVVADALRAGHECDFYPGETNFRSADVIVISKTRHAGTRDIAVIRDNARRLNPNAEIIESDLTLEVADPDAIADKRVLIVEDGPTLTHGGMEFGSGFLAAEQIGVSDIVDPRPGAAGTIATVFQEFPHIRAVLPACGYSSEQLSDLEQTIRNAEPEVIVDASPAGIDRLLSLPFPVVRVGYRFLQTRGRPLEERVMDLLKR
ncbi:MAG: tetraacyldisaccharide 4'-kinase, partial [Planctomycetota bacterium]